MDKYINTPINAEITQGLHAGDYVYISGTIYVARDAAHKRMAEALDRVEKDFNGDGKLGQEELSHKLREALPFPIVDSAIYYMGPSPAREGKPIGSAGPTTASRMDKYASRLLDLGQKAMIGKGKRAPEVIDGIVRNQAVYFAAVGGAGALLSKCIKKSELVCYGDLGAEAILKLEVQDFPVIVVIDRDGNNLYESAAREYAK
ncbi:MAG: TRZ/ATZ family protein [Lachnospiraceae bacterium]|nr:TRZ/ATZ family protein [Lachnospiraceae bacterium]